MMHLHIPHTIHPFVLVSTQLSSHHSLTFPCLRTTLFTPFTHFSLSRTTLFTPFTHFSLSRTALFTLQSHSYKHIVMLGLSGGGWSTTLASAVDDRIRVSFPTAGSVPFALKVGHDVLFLLCALVSLSLHLHSDIMYFCSNLMHVHDLSICFGHNSLQLCALFVLLIATSTLPVLFARFLCFVLSTAFTLFSLH
jgi:hypothetical protein